MKIHYFAYLRNEARCREESVAGSFRALALLEELAQKHGPALRKHLLSEDGTEIHQDLIFLVDGRHVEFLDGKDTMIPESALVSLFPRIAGG